MGISMENDVQTLILPNKLKQLFFLENSETFSPQVFFNEVPVEGCFSKEHLGLHLDQKLDFSKHINEKISKGQKGISVIKKLCNILPRNALLTKYNLFDCI